MIKADDLSGGAEDFLIAVLTLPGSFAGEAECLGELLEAGVERLHLRKPGMEAVDLERLVERLAPRWAERLVLHGNTGLALRYGIGQVHGSVELVDGRGHSGGGPFVGKLLPVAAGGPAISTSVHNWEEFGALPAGLAYAFISPLFDSISKKGYRANAGLLELPLEGLPCRPMGLGGVWAENIGELVRRGWKRAAVLGWIWEEPGKAVWRYEQLKKKIDGAAEGIGGGGL
jgi:thiamine monophosphate synthase